MPDENIMKCIEEGKGHKYLGILEADGIKHEEMKYQVSKEYVRRFRTTLKSKQNGRNIISTINYSRAVSIITGIIGWTKEKLQKQGS